MKPAPPVTRYLDICPHDSMAALCGLHVAFHFDDGRADRRLHESGGASKVERAVPKRPPIARLSAAGPVTSAEIVRKSSWHGTSSVVIGDATLNPVESVLP